MQEEDRQLVLSVNAVQYTVDTATPIIAFDFVGYLGVLDRDKDRVLYLVDLDGNFELVSGDKNRPVLPRRLKRKWMRRCMKEKFLEYVLEPFTDLSIQFNLPFDATRAQMIPSNIISKRHQYRDNGKQ